MVCEITRDVFEKKLLVSKKLLILFCNRLNSTGTYLMELSLKELSQKYSKTLDVFKIDVSDNESLIKKYNLFSFPSLLFFKDGELLETINGPIPLGKIDVRIKSTLGK